MNQATLDFIKANAESDVRRLALQKRGTEGVDLAFALDQIAGWQTARRKLPSWAGVDGVVYPPHLSMEQCSGEAAARYKARVAEELGATRTLVDITGGFGVDFFFLSERFAEAVYVERQEHLCAIARDNFAVLGRNQAEVVCADGVGYLRNMPHASLLFIDPARRNHSGGRTYSISDCTPDVSVLKEQLLDRADYVMIKLSPMLDWRKAVGDMASGVGQVHIVSVGGECKELLLVMSKRYEGLERVVCVNDGDVFTYDPSVEVASEFASPRKGWFLYEPNASVMKAGCFAWLGQTLGMAQLACDSHLFVSDHRMDTFPGRGFVIERISTMNKKEVRKILSGVERANIATRNFPLSVAQLRGRLKMKEGGDVYIFATTLMDMKHVLLVCSKNSI